MYRSGFDVQGVLIARAAGMPLEAFLDLVHSTLEPGQ